MTQEYETRGRTIATTVTTRLARTVFFFPILFMSRLVGTERRKNQRNTIEGRKLAIVSDRAKSALT